jgi:hypothetical protein
MPSLDGGEGWGARSPEPDPDFSTLLTWLALTP